MRALVLTVLCLVGLSIPAKADVPMPAELIVISCKVEIAGPPDKNAAWTHVENLQWAFENSQMQCRREVLALVDSAIQAAGPGLPADPQPFNPQRCQKTAAALLGSGAGHYRVFRVACPTPMVRRNPDGTPTIVGWVEPDCGMRGLIRCDKDSVI